MLKINTMHHLTIFWIKILQNLKKLIKKYWEIFFE